MSTLKDRIMSLQSKQIIIAGGGTSFLGISFATHLQGQVADVLALSRNRPKPAGQWAQVP